MDLWRRKFDFDSFRFNKFPKFFAFENGYQRMQLGKSIISQTIAKIFNALTELHALHAVANGRLEK